LLGDTGAVVVVAEDNGVTGGIELDFGEAVVVVPEVFPLQRFAFVVVLQIPEYVVFVVLNVGAASFGDQLVEGVVSVVGFGDADGFLAAVVGVVVADLA